MSLTPLKIGIVGAGFSGTALTVALHELSRTPLEIIIFEKTGCFGSGDAYRTPYAYHLLNVRAKDMSVYENNPEDFVEWLCKNPEAQKHLDQNVPVREQFVSRKLYGQYLQSFFKRMLDDSHQLVKLHMQASEVVDVKQNGQQIALITAENKTFLVDKVVFAIGNNPVSSIPFEVPDHIQVFKNPWDYSAIKNIAHKEPVLILGTGLSMIDAVLTLHHQQHQGQIYALSRHGLLPLSHEDPKNDFFEKNLSSIPTKLTMLVREMRLLVKDHMNKDGDWRTVVNALRAHIPMIWQKLSLRDKKRFLNHVLSYWNIHRHRVPNKVLKLLKELSERDQLHIISGRVLAIEDNILKISQRQCNNTSHIKISSIINCMGPALTMKNNQPLISALSRHGLAAFDTLNMGFSISNDGALENIYGKPSEQCFVLGPLTKGTYWECTAVPEIRKHTFDLVKHLLAMIG